MFEGSDVIFDHLLLVVFKLLGTIFKLEDELFWDVRPIRLKG